MFLYDLKTVRERYRWFQTEWYAQQPWRATLKFVWWAFREIDDQRVCLQHVRWRSSCLDAG